MSRTAYIRWTSGANLYAKPLPLATGTWEADAIAFVENGVTGSYSVVLPDEPHEIFVQAGGTPADTDQSIAPVPSNDSAVGIEETLKSGDTLRFEDADGSTSEVHDVTITRL